MINYDEFGTLVLSDELAQQVAGGTLDVTVSVLRMFGANGGCYGLRVGQVPVSENVAVNGVCDGGSIQTGSNTGYGGQTSYTNAACANNTGGMNPVCFTNAGCG